VVVVPIGGATPRLAAGLATRGATVVLVADEEDAADAGRVAAEIEAAGTGRPAVYVSPPDDLESLAQLLAELFSPR
jgi:NAD(P)-dependent dehydrogenase (short-subunit alcohol dehydrogenase family)